LIVHMQDETTYKLGAMTPLTFKLSFENFY
jgi:hypothetical protein